MFAWNAFILTKQITSCFVTGKFRKVNFPSHDWVCDDRIRHLNPMRSLIVLSTKVNNNVDATAPSKWPRASGGYGSGWNDSQGVTYHFNVSRITISRLTIRLRQTGRRNDRPRVTSQNQDRHLLLIHLRNRIMAEYTTRRTPALANVRISGRTVRRKLRESADSEVGVRW